MSARARAKARPRGAATTVVDEAPRAAVTDDRPAAPGVPSAGADGVALAHTLVLLALALARAALAFVPTMWGWGMGLLRFVDPIPGWALWAVSAVALVPWLARRAMPALAALGHLLERSTVMGYVVWAALPGALAWLLPDRIRFVGDFLLRFGTAEQALKPSALFPQALPIDVFLHYRLARWCDTALGMDVNTSARILGALEAALIGVLAWAFARALALRGAAAIATAAVVLFGGYLAMFTGYGKAIAEVTLLTAAFAVFGLRLIRGGRGLLPLGACVAFGLALHRSTLGLVPALALCWLFAWRTPGALARESRATLWIAVALPLAALAVMLPRIAGTFATMDHVHFTPPEVVRRGGILGAMFAGTRPMDLLSVVVLLSPLALVAPFVAAVLGPPRGRGRELLLLLTLALPWLAMLLTIHPPQGMFRDWDDFAAAGLTLSMLTAWLVAVVVSEAPGWAWLCVPVALGAGVPTLHWLMHEADMSRGLTRIEAYLTEAPQRTEEERAKTWDFLGIRYAQLDRWNEAAAAMSHAAVLAPSPRILLQWASAEQARGNDGMAQEIYRRLVLLDVNEARGWYGLAFVSWRLGDMAECRRAANGLLRARPGNAQALDILAEVNRRDSTRVEKAK